MKIFTDGSCLENPGPGGWAFVCFFTKRENEKRGIKVEAGHELNTTNNRMEMLAALNALLYVRGLIENGEVKREAGAVEVVSDSAYVVNAINKGWIESWKKNEWKTAKGQDVKNKEYWVAIDNVMKQINRGKKVVAFVKVKGHSGNSMNELVDKIAREKATYASKLVK